MKSAEIRESFIHFFESKKHKRVESAPVLPLGDKSLLFTNAGMNQFKSIFLDTEVPTNFRVANSQKCIRVSGKHNDLEEVGRDGFHHTFFEMLGNWSFGDYYKKEAIEWSWELLTEVWKLDKSRLWVTVYKDDDEAFNFWKNCTDIDEKRIVRCGAKDNFWEMAETGPCGPCSEIHYYVGDDIDNQKSELVNNSDQYWELWNLVFIQFNRKSDGSTVDLPKKHVDTGAGLERICSVLQGKDSNYKTDLFEKTISEIESISGAKYNKNEITFNVICDHIRMLSFAIADGVLPSNDGRGYVIRRVLRRALKFGLNLKIEKPFLHRLVGSVVLTMSNHYPELKNNQQHIEKTILEEEELFLRTLDNGLIQFEKIISKSTKQIVSGKDAFKLYDTFGFPLDLTELMANERGKEVDVEEFKVEMNKQKELAKSNQKFVIDSIDFDWKYKMNHSNSNFMGYESDSLECKIINWASFEDETFIILDQTPFYAESGGQVGDTGKIFNKDFNADVLDTKKNGDFIIHVCKVKEGQIRENLNVEAKIDSERRAKIKSNHSATHLLHKALRDKLGDSVNQAGSLVHPDYLRFDITYPKKITKKEILQIEENVIEMIKEDIQVTTSKMSLDRALKSGAMALFDEKYNNEVRVVIIGDSKELCGGTHVSTTMEISKFRIKSEKAVSAGVRRIQAITGEEVEIFMEDEKLSLIEMEKISQKKEDDKRHHKEMLEKIDLEKIISSQRSINGINLICAEINLGNANDLKTLNKKLKNNYQNGIAIFWTRIDKKMTISVSVTKNLQSKSLLAGMLAKSISSELGGGGGGKNDFAMAGIGIENSNEDILKAIDKSILKELEN